LSRHNVFMEDEKNIDDLFRKAVEPYTVPPPPKVWSSLDAELARKQATLYQQKANRYKWLSIALLFLFASFVAYHFLSENTGKKAQPGVAEVKPVRNETAVIRDQKQETGKVQADEVPANSSAVPSYHLQKASLLQPDDHKSIRNKKTTAENAVKGKSKIPDAVSHSFSKGELTNENNLADNPTPIHDDQSVQKQETVNKNNDQEAKIPAVPEPVLSLNSAPEKQQEQQIQEGNTNAAQSSSTSAGDNSKPGSNAAVPSASSHEDSVSAHAWAAPGRNILSKFSIALFYSPDYKNNHLKDNDPNDDENISEYKNREKPAYSFTTGLQLRYDLNEHWGLAAGASYMTYSYDMTFSTVYIHYGFDNQLHYQYPTSCGNVEIPNPPSKNLHDGDSLNITVGCIQSLKLINVPLMVRFQQKNTGMSWFTEAGLSANIILREEVDLSIAGHDMHVVNHIDGLQKMNFGYLLGAGVQYNYMKGIGFFIEPVFRGSITSLTEDISVNCYPYSFGLKTGVSYHF